MTLLIKNVHVVGADKPYPETSDVFVNDDRISAIGNFPNKKADATVDGQGFHLSPGFIDVNTDSDHYLSIFDHPEQDDFLRQGVTTIFGGMCGSSLAPLLYGSLESFEKWSDPKAVNVNWHTMGEFLGVMGKRQLGVNFGTLAGHSTIRRSIVGDDPRDLTKNELKVFSDVAERAMKEGSFGLSTGLAYVHARKTPYSEIKALADVVKKYGGVYATHLRDGEKGIEDAVDETVKLSKETGVKTLISHFVPVTGCDKEYEAALAEIGYLPPEADFNFDIYPSTSRLLALYTFLPAWAQNGNIGVMLANLKDEWLVGRIKKDMPALDEDHFVIAQAPNNEFLVGKTLTDVKEMYNLRDGRDALLRLMTTMNMQGGVLYKSIDANLARKAMTHPRSLIASNAPSFAEDFRRRQLKSDRTTRTFTDFLRMVEEEKLMPLDEAVQKLTAIPAKKFGLKERGKIAVGNIADLTCFKNGEVKFTVVNGRLAMQDGEFKGAFAGKSLRHNPRT